MGRTATNKELNPAQDGFSEQRLAEAEQAAHELVAMNAEREKKVKMLAATLHYTGSTHPDALEAGALEAQRQIQMGLFALGNYLILLREGCEHGDFLIRLDRIGVEPRVAQRHMQISRRFANASSKSYLEELGKTKLLELLVLDDEQIEELELTGQTGELRLDEFATMSVKELRAALREAKADAEATDRVLADNQKTITKLQKAASKTIDPQEEWSGVMRELALHVAGHRANFLESITALDVIREKVMQQEAEPGAEAALAAAREQIGRELAEAVERAEELVSKVRRTFDVTLGALIGN